VPRVLRPNIRANKLACSLSPHFYPLGGIVSKREPQIILKTASEAFTSSHGATEYFSGESSDWNERQGFPRGQDEGPW
jgi:hypothetical protein